MATGQSNINVTQQSGNIDYGCAHLTGADFKECRRQLKDIVIAPFDFAKAKGVGYNFSLSELIYSITRKRLVPICRDAHETYFYLRPHETVLALSYEYLKVDKCIAGSFHSRVRITAQGVGSISTTLDPAWKGMLLFSLNNPTRKKIKIVLSTRVEGAVINQAVLTLIAWRTAKPTQTSKSTQEDEHFTLHLDNPPMRIDIWSELAAKPMRLFRNRDYQVFSKLIQDLSPFESQPSQDVCWAKGLSELITQLRIEIESKKSDEGIREALIHIQSQAELPDAVKKCLNTLTAVLNENDILKECEKQEYLDAIDLANREIEYQILCDQISQIHDLISKRVPTSWHKNFFANVWYQILKNAGVIIGTIIAILLIVYGNYNGDSSYWPELIAAIIPLVASVITNLISSRK